MDDKDIISFDPRALDTSSHVNAAKVEAISKKMQKGQKIPPVVVYPDYDGRLYVAEGTHRVEAARANGNAPVKGRIVEDDNYLVGKQGILTRIIHMFFG